MHSGPCCASLPLRCGVLLALLVLSSCECGVVVLCCVHGYVVFVALCCVHGVVVFVALVSMGCVCEIVCLAPNVHTFSKTTVEPLRATQSHSRATEKSFSSFQIPRSRATRVQHFQVRGRQGSVSSMFAVASARASFMVAPVPWSVVPFTRVSTAPNANSNNTHHGSQKSRTYPSPQGHGPVGARSCVAVLVVLLRFHGHVHQPEQLQQM